MNALVDRDSARLYQKLQHVRRTMSKDGTIPICRFLGSAIQRWAAASYLDALPAREAAQEIGISPWEYSNLVLPGARAWGRTGSVALLRVVARAERAVLRGAQDPWLVLVSGLLAACQPAGR